MYKFGVDIGGVIRVIGENGKVYREGAVDAIRSLIETFGPNNAVIISRSLPENRGLTTAWLVEHHFFRDTGFNPENIHYCLERSEKAGVAKSLGVGYFVDNHFEVFAHMQKLKAVPHRFLLWSDRTVLRQPIPVIGSINVAFDWRTAHDQITHTLRSDRRSSNSIAVTY